MKRITTLILTLAVALTALAVPARPGYLRDLLAAGDTARYEDMLRHERLNRAMRPRESLVEHARLRAASSDGPHREFAVTPLLASRGLLILVNFTDQTFRSTNTRADLDSMMNARNYTYNGATGSAAQYYADQSLGAYRPHFDVVGPITVPNKESYYGTNNTAGNDKLLGDFVLHACSIASGLDGVNLADYDEDNDGVMDFVYILYAGKGEADGGASTTLWPASFDMPSAIAGGFTSYSTSQYNNTSLYTFDGVQIGSFAYSGELNGQTGARNGIGTPTHEFGHVLGFPDFYDVNYGTNYRNEATPGEWDIMDSGSYNNDGMTPPNMSPWEKAFMGWITPVNPGNTGADLVLYPNGSDSANIIQLNASGTYQDYNASGVCYYLENRRQTGWDAYIPGHGMLIWRLDYDQSVFTENGPNATAGNCRYTVVSATGSSSNIGSSADPFPGTGGHDSWSGLNSKPLTAITETGDLVTFQYMGGTPCDGYGVTYAGRCATLRHLTDYECLESGASYAGTLVWKSGYLMDSVVVTMGGVRLSGAEPGCTIDSTTVAISSVTGNVRIAAYGHRPEGLFDDCDNYVWTPASALATGSNLLGAWTWNVSVDGRVTQSYDASSGAIFSCSSYSSTAAVTLSTEEASGCMIDSILVTSNTGSWSGEGSLSAYIDGVQIGETKTLQRSSRRYLFTNPDDLQGTLELRFTGLSGSVYLKKIDIRFQRLNEPEPPYDTALETTEDTPDSPVRKVFRNGTLRILVGDREYTVLGERL